MRPWHPQFTHVAPDRLANVQWWKAALAANTRRTMADDDREDNGWILLGRKENSRDILTYERPEYIVQREQPTCDKKW